MENSYDIYKSTNSAGISIPINDNIFYEHAKNYSFQKNIDFFISKYKEQFILFPPYHMEYYFSITSKYRKKNSGSGNPGQKYKSDIEKQLKSFSPTFSLHMGNSKTKTFVNITTNLDKQYLYGTLATYYCRLNSSNNYRITKCSNTSNPTVIFQLKTKGYQRDEDLKIFLDKINNI